MAQLLIYKLKQQSLSSLSDFSFTDHIFLVVMLKDHIKKRHYPIKGNAAFASIMYKSSPRRQAK